jgi:hypothetical protein
MNDFFAVNCNTVFHWCRITVDKNGNKKYFITQTIMAAVWARLQDRLASIDSSTGMIQVVPDCAAHFYDMYVKNHDGKHMTGDQIKILLLNLPFMLRDLILPEVMCTSVTFIVSIVYVVYDVLTT